MANDGSCRPSSKAFGLGNIDSGARNAKDSLNCSSRIYKSDHLLCGPSPGILPPIGLESVPGLGSFITINSDTDENVYQGVVDNKDTGHLVYASIGTGDAVKSALGSKSA